MFQSLSDQLNDIQISCSGDSGGTISPNGGTITFTGTLALFAYALSGATNEDSYLASNGLIMFRSGYGMRMTPEGSGSRLSFETNNSTYTVTNNSSTAMRYFLFLKP